MTGLKETMHIPSITSRLRMLISHAYNLVSWAQCGGFSRGVGRQAALGASRGAGVRAYD